MKADLLISGIGKLVQVRDRTPDFLAGPQMASVPTVDNAWVAVKNGHILSYGTGDKLPDIEAREKWDAQGGWLFPGFVDSHTHIVYAASREEEFEMKIKGATYEEIAARGGGILNSARRLQQMGEDELFQRTMPRIREVMHTGTAAIEIKSGYGLTVQDEIKMLRVARRIGRETPLTVRTTFLGAHAVPRDTTKEKYIQAILQEMIPAIAAEGLADYIDVFCEEGFFSQKETEMIVGAGKRHGMTPRIHANQLHRSGGVQAGVASGAISVDHLEQMGDEEIEVLRGTKTMPTALPGAAFFLNLPFPPARKMIQAGLPLAIASDFNPGSAPSGNMPLMLSLACIRMKITPEEAINAATINTAYALNLLDKYGSITAGKVASFYVTKPLPSLAFLPYSFGSNLIQHVFLRGIRL
ncbi:MAG TPA: imidazolonepropionase [Cyclobacteriaceae bacterium]|nr:imidazolonepropionase [Cyclobacteriaceae bacterium]